MTPQARRSMATIGLLVGALALGLVVVKMPLLAFLFVAAVIGGWSALEPRVRPVLVGVLLVAYMNAIPFADLSVIRLPGGIRFDDVTMGLMFMLGLAWTARVGRRSPLWRLRTALAWVCVYWAAVLFFTVGLGTGTVALSALYGRDFLAIVVALAIAAVTVDDSDAEVFLAVILGFACIFSVAHLVQLAFGVDMSAFMHQYKSSELLGQARFYARAMAFMVPAFLVALGRALIGEQGRRRVMYWIASGLIGLEILGQFTRANYLGMIAALVLGALILGRVRTERAESRTVIALVVMAFSSMGAWLIAGSRLVTARLGSTSVFQRFASTSSELSSGGGTFGYRLTLYETSLGVLGPRWPVGLGFLHPAENYIALLPQGEVRNNDTGVLGVIMTMGVIGLLVLAWPLAMSVRWAWRAVASAHAPSRMAAWSVLTYSIWVALTAFSLGFLSFGYGLASTALVVGLMTSALHAEQGQERSS